MKKLQRSKEDRMISGVCGGIGEYLNVDPIIIRILYVFIGLRYFGTAIIVYLVCYFIIPEGDGVIYSDYEAHEHNERIRRNTPVFIGGGLIIWGSFMMAKLLFPWFNLRLLQLGRFWPALLIILGVYILINPRN